MPTQPLPAVRLATLLDQQLWFIGHDIRHADGNALVRYGFERIRSDAGGTTCYRLAGAAAGRDLVCWGFGVFVGPGTAASGTGRHGVLMQRHAASPRLLAAPLPLPLHKPSELPRLRLPVTGRERDEVNASRSLVASVLGDYEQWARIALGSAHRARVLTTLPRHKRRRFWVATDLAPLWQPLRQARADQPPCS